MRRPEDANGRWADLLAGWAIPDELLAGPAQTPYYFDPDVFARVADAALLRDQDSPSDIAAREALPAGGTVLDIGAGAGAASLRLDAARVVGVDPSRPLLNAFAERGARRGIETILVEGSWPGVATQTPSADVVVCHHVVYNVADLAGFALALTAHAEIRVVVELTSVHPMSWMAPYWQAVHGLARPNRPTVDDAIAVLAEAGFDVFQQRWQRPMDMIGGDDDDQFARIARRLCLAADRHDELRRVLSSNPPPRRRDVATLWWPGEARLASPAVKQWDGCWH